MGIMKGVLLEKAPDAQIIDITHQIAPQNIHQAAYALKSAHSYFPKGTIHVVVVDPGVGSERRPVLIETSRAKYIGPDNGVFSYVLEKAQGYITSTRKNILQKRFLQPSTGETCLHRLPDGWQAARPHHH